MANAELDLTKEGLKPCEFCEIGNDTGPRIQIIGDDNNVSFLSRTDGHPLIIPRKHIANLDEPFQERDVSALLNFTMLLYPKVKQVYRSLGATRFKLESNDGGREHVPHLHLHIRGYIEKGGIPETIAINEGEDRIKFADDIKTLFDPC